MIWRHQVGFGCDYVEESVSQGCAGGGEATARCTEISFDTGQERRAVWGESQGLWLRVCITASKYN